MITDLFTAEMLEAPIAVNAEMELLECYMCLKKVTELVTVAKGEDKVEVCTRELKFLPEWSRV